MNTDCPFCARIKVEDHQRAATFADAFPSAEGHRLVVPVRHVERVEDLDPEEWRALFNLVREVAREVAGLPGVDGVNVGINSGEAAGQTVGHTHVHVIPRRTGDVPDPRGGIRWVLPDTAAYWSGKEPSSDE